MRRIATAIFDHHGTANAQSPPLAPPAVARRLADRPRDSACVYAEEWDQRQDERHRSLKGLERIADAPQPLAVRHGSFENGQLMIVPCDAAASHGLVGTAQGRMMAIAPAENAEWLIPFSTPSLPQQVTVTKEGGRLADDKGEIGLMPVHQVDAERWADPLEEF